MESDLAKLIDAISSVKGVVAVILFGSYAKGVFDEYSDCDLLVIFEDRKSMWARWNELFSKIGKLRLLVHAIPKTIDEFWRSEPTFLAEVLAYGKLLYMRYPFEAPAMLAKLERMAIVSYDMKGLDQKAKARLVYKLYGRKAASVQGLVERVGGIKLSEGCLLVPGEAVRQVKETIESCGANVRIIQAYASRGELHQA